MEEITPIYNSVNYKDLPKKFHQIFDGTVEIDDKVVQCIK